MCVGVVCPYFAKREGGLGFRGGVEAREQLGIEGAVDSLIFQGMRGRAEGVVRSGGASIWVMTWAWIWIWLVVGMYVLA